MKLLDSLELRSSVVPTCICTISSLLSSMEAVNNNNIFTWEPRLFLKPGRKYSQVPAHLHRRFAWESPPLRIQAVVFPVAWRCRREEGTYTVGRGDMLGSRMCPFLERSRVGAVELLFVVLPRRPARRGGCHTLALLCLPRQMPPPLHKSCKAVTATRAASGRGLTELTAFVGLWPGRAFMFLLSPPVPFSRKVLGQKRLTFSIPRGVS